MFNVEINYQTKVPHKYEALFQKLGLKTIKILKAGDDISLSVAFVGLKKIKELNKSYRNKDKVTDVLSFDEVNEIIICYSQAARQARKLEHSIKKEVSILFVHGLLHLLGFDDRTKKGALLMEGVTKKVLSKV